MFARRPLSRSTYGPTPFSIVAPSPRSSSTTVISSSQSHLKHSRRPSSSKASCPPGSSKGPEETTANTSQSTTQGDKREKDRRPGGPLTKRKSKAATVEGKDPFAKVPAVPSTDHLAQNDVFLSSLFALHRPISVTKSIPPTTSKSAFDSIFESRPEPSHKPQDVIRTLSSAVSSFENPSNSSRSRDSHSSQQTNNPPSIGWEIIQPPSNSQSVTVDANGTTHLDGPPAPTLNELLSRFRPFQKPPPPLSQNQMKAEARRSRRDPPKSTTEEHVPTPASRELKQYRTTLTIDEETNSSGGKTYTARASPIIETIVSPHRQFRQSRQPFLTRMRSREEENIRLVEEEVRLAQQQQQQQTYEDPESPSETAISDEAGQSRETMDLLSVKRQRKLKMKKHKYKKLMKRTRHLRRKLER